MVFTVELRYETGASTILSTEADTADQALSQVRDPRRDLVSIRVSSSVTDAGDSGPAQPSGERENAGFRRVPAHHRRSRRHP
jgi:hypothetical protein